MKQIRDYEISVWGDRIVKEKPTEVKLATIGSSVNKAPHDAFDIRLTSNINGTKQLTFNMPGKELNTLTGEYITNRSLQYLLPEAVIKVRVGKAYDFSPTGVFNPAIMAEDDIENKWISLKIKEIDDESVEGIYTYSAEETYITELGRNGFEVAINEDLGNNYGTLDELAKIAFADSGWDVVVDTVPRETITEFIGALTLKNDLSAKQIITGASLTIPAGSKIYLPYSTFETTSSPWTIAKDTQLLYHADGLNGMTVGEDGVIVDYNLDLVYTVAKIPTGTQPVKLLGSEIGEQPLQAKFLVKRPLSKYVEEIDRIADIVSVKNASVGLPLNTNVYRYETTDFLSTSLVKNYVTNNKAFVSTSAWMPKVATTTQSIPVVTSVPIYERLSANNTDKITNYLALKVSPTTQQIWYNEGPTGHGMKAVKGEKYLIRVKAKSILPNAISYWGTVNPAQDHPNVYYSLGYWNSNGSWTAITNEINLAAKAAQLDSKSVDMTLRGFPTPAATRPSGFNTTPKIDEQGFVYGYVTSTATTNTYLHKIEMRVRIPAHVFPDGKTYQYSIDTVQVGDAVLDNKGIPIFPGDIPSPEFKVSYKYVNVVNGEVHALPDTDSWYAPVYPTNSAAMRHFEVEESNRYNIAQELSELFEVWADFQIVHQKNGMLKRKANGEPIKRVIFRQHSPSGGARNEAGFKYGINLNGISRTTDSNALSSKVIVKDNNQEHATSGGASITRAVANPHGDNEIYNFDYFIRQGSLDQVQVLRDLYGLTPTDFAYYKKLKALNEQYNSIARVVGPLETDLIAAERAIEAYDISLQEVSEELRSNSTLMAAISSKDTKRKDEAIAVDALLRAQQAEMKLERAKNQKIYTTNKGLINTKKAEIKTILANKQKLKAEFSAKYRPYILEGTWIDETYIDDELYYIDAVRTANTTAFPQATYQINVIDISAADEFKNYEYEVGKLTTVEDPDYFGWVIKTIPTIGQVRTPYKMEAVITETVHVLDDPTQASIEIKNYKNNFEDFFQRVGATTNQVQMREGEYLKANQILTESGDLKVETIAEAFKKNAIELASSNNEDVKFDSSGLTLTDTDNSTYIVRAFSKGIYISEDGGKTWSAGVTGSGINARALTAGIINAEKINITTDDTLRFRWDENGITAFDKAEDGTYSMDQYVRFNDYGMYGTAAGSTIQDALADTTTRDEALKVIANNANWSLTWAGLYLNDPEGGVSLTPKGGLEVYNPNWLWTQEVINDPNAHAIESSEKRLYIEGERIPLIALGKQYDSLDSSPYYGMRMRNREGYETLLTNYDGDLWLKNTLELGSGDVATIEIDSTAPDGATTKITEQYLKYLNFNGNPDETLPYIDTPLIAVGDTEVAKAPFRVYGDGYVVMEKALVLGDFVARNFKLEGNINLGEMAGINGYADENGEFNHTFWSGRTLGGYPTWYVTPEGKMVAEEAYINGTGTFEGDIYANNGYFNGTVNASSGKYDGQVFFGDTTSYVGPDGSGLYINIEDNFKVDEIGNIYGNTLRLFRNDRWVTDGATLDEQYNLLIGQNGSPITIYNPSADKQDEVVFGVDDNGDVILAGTLRTGEDLILGGKLKSVDNDFVIDGNAGSITSGIPGSTGWGIYGNGDAFFDNIVARGKITASVFEYDKVSSVGGTLLVSPSFVSEEPHSITADFKVDLSDEAGITDTWVNVNKVLINVRNIDYDHVPFDYATKTITLDAEAIETLRITDTLPKGTIIISTSTYTNSIMLKATNPKGSYIKIEGPHADSQRSTVLLGNLTKELIPTAHTEIFGNDLGYGLYADNAYLTGKLYLPQAGMTNGDDDYKGSPIRIFAGAAPLEKEKSPFIVTEDGTMYSRQAVIEGTIYAEDSIFSGHIVASGVLLDNDLADGIDDHFYISNDWGLKSGPDGLDYVMNFTKDGTEFWHGWELFSRETSPADQYKYSDKNRNPWPVMKAYDGSNEITPHLSTKGSLVWGADETSTGVRIEPGVIGIVGILNNANSSLGFDGIDTALWQSQSLMNFGLIDHRYEKHLGIQTTDTFYFTDGEHAAMTVTPRTDSTGIRKNAGAVNLLSDTFFGDKVKVETTSKGIVFTYLGD